MIDFKDVELRAGGQQEVGEYSSGMMAVPAVPGAGKTFTLAYLAADLIAEGYLDSSKILIVTYMNSAVANFRSRIDKFLEARGLATGAGYEVKTLHSLAMGILKERPDYLLINDEFKVLDENEQQRIINRLTQKWLSENRSRWERIIDRPPNTKWHSIGAEKWQEKAFPGLVKTMVGQLKSHGLDRDQVKKLRNKLAAQSYLAWVCEIYLDYAQELASNGLLDFNDLIVNAWRLLNEDQILRSRLQQRWGYIFEDEAQDSNLIQQKMLYLLAADHGNLVRVGDSNQSIMGTFTLAEPDLFREFCRRDDVERGAILASSRSTEQIIDLANYLVNWTRKEHPVPDCQQALEGQLIQTVTEDDPYPNPKLDGYGISTQKYETRAEEIELTVKKAIKQVESNPDETLAILVPNRYTQEEVVERLKEEDAPFVEVGGISQEQARTIEHLEDAVSYLARPHQQGQLDKLLKSLFLEQFAEVELEAVDQLLKDYSVAEIIYPTGGQLAPIELPEELFNNSQLYTALQEALDQIRYWLEASLELSADELILFLAEELGLKDDTLALAQGIALYFKDELRANPGWRLVDIVDQLSNLKPSFKQLAKKLYDTKGFEAQAGVITLLTAHKAKGLEWDTVFVTSLVADEYQTTVDDSFRGEQWYLAKHQSNPVAVAKAELDEKLGKTRRKDPVFKAKVDVISERLRLLYVAITRAKKRLVLSAYQKRKNWNGTKLNDVEVSHTFKVLDKYITKERKEYAD
ncbi:ATP-dependent helicase [Natroniella sulfidigena]|uniref:ATP-dependent helicase n=1 Tax=Natroniella sulfidigena TaxID=723921 RepID=UPI00200A9D3A|nr:ATP-dependent helicase [Natroniella sulfidigena]